MFKEILDVDASDTLDVKFPRTLKISVKGAKQVFPPVGDGATIGDTLLIFAGTARFGQDEDNPGEEPDNRRDEDTEADNVNNPSQLTLQLRAGQFAGNVFVGAAAMTCHANFFVSTEDAFGVDTANTATLLATPTNNQGRTLHKDIWLFSDLFVEKNSQINRVGYQTVAVLKTRS